MRNPALSRVVRGLSSRTSTAAIIAGFVLVAPFSHAISAGFTGTPTAVSGSFDTLNSSQIVLNTVGAQQPVQAVINWSPTDTATSAGAPIDFLPSGNSAVFRSQGGSQTFTILNRVLPTDMSRPIALNGMIQSYVNASSGTNYGGSIWFYSPAGILVGSSGALNIGSLLLTSSDPIQDGQHNFITTDSGGAHFSLGLANNGSKVTVASGAQINAMVQTGSYVALIAPSVQQSGTVTVNGSAAYVAARAADMTINQGLFDISVKMPSEESGPQLIHDGSTGMTFASGTAPGAADTHRIYLVSVPKNDAITLLIQGGSHLGFDIAGGATVQGSAIVLSAGKNVAEASTFNPIDFSSTPTTANASIAINTGTFTSAVLGAATHNAIVSNGGQSVGIDFVSDLSLSAPNLVSVGSAASGQSVSIGGNLTLDASVNGTTTGSPITAGTAQLFATGGGGITVGGMATILATASGSGSAITSGAPVSATGGIAQIQSFGGAIDITGTTTLEANAFSGSSSSAPAASLTLTGGQVNVQASGSGASVHFHDALNASATNSIESNPLGYDAMGNAVAGTSGQGGAVTLQNSGGGTLTADGFVTLNADGYGQPVQYGPVGGAGTGGAINVDAAGGGITLADGLVASAMGRGGDVGNTTSSGGLGMGGQIMIGTSNATGSLIIGQAGSESSLNVGAGGQGGSFGVTGGNGVGGQVHLANNGGTTHVFVLTSLDAGGSGGTGVMSGTGIGGLAEITSSGGTMTLDGPASLSASGGAGGANNGQTGTPLTGNAIGGTAQIVTTGAGQIIANADVMANAGAFTSFDVGALAGGNATGGNFNIFANGTGSIHLLGGVTGDVSGTGGASEQLTGSTGTGTGGHIGIDARDSSVLTIDGNVLGDGRGWGGDALQAGAGGIGKGGTLLAGGGTGSLTISSLTYEVDGKGGGGVTNGGVGMGGAATIQAFGGPVTITNDLVLSANANGGNGLDGGNAVGGSTTVTATSGILTIGGTVNLSGNTIGGVGFPDQTNIPLSGNAQGGTMTLSTGGTGQLVVNGDVDGNARASIGNDSISYNGGTAVGGTFNIFANGTGSIHVLGNVNGDLSANGGGNQILTGAAGTGTGGNMGIDARNTTTLTIDGAVEAFSTGFGGGSEQAGIGGAGTGGMLLAGGGSGTLSIGSLSYNVDGSGGNGLTGGGVGMGGTATVQAFSGNVTIKGGLDLEASGFGGDADVQRSASAGTNAVGGMGRGGTAYVNANGGNITIGSAAATDSHIAINASGQGGDGYTGGVGMGGDPEILARGSTVTFTPSSNANTERTYAVLLTANGDGGSGGTGSDGSAGIGGVGNADIGPTVLAFTTSATGLESRIVLNGNVALIGRGQGGTGGDNTASGTGGTGGAGIGALPIVDAQSGNGHITTGDLTMDDSGIGGDGGSGNIGGAGGAGTGGNAQAGVYSGALTTVTNGTASFGAYNVFSYGEGGEGGVGTIMGGAGGAGNGGFGSITSRGGVVTAASAALSSDGIGGAGGGTSDSENIQADGAGGAGRGGGFSILSTPRFQTSVVGSLAVAGAITGTATGYGGVGSTTGSTSVGQFQVQAIGGTLSAQSLTGVIRGATIPTDTPASEISAVGTGTITIANVLSVTSTGDVGLYFDQGGRLNADTAAISARSVTPFGGQDTAAPTGTGTFHANTLAFSVTQDFRTTASFDTPNGFQLFVPGITQIGAVNAGLGITINFNSAMGATHGTGLTTGNLTTGRTALLQTDGNASIGSVTARDSLISVAQGTTVIGNISAGRGGALASTPQGYVINVFSNAGSTIGSTTAAGEIRFGSLSGSIAAGNVVTDRDLIVLAAQNVSLGSITTSLVPTVGGPSGNQATNPGGVYIGLATGTILPAAQTFSTDPAPIGGSITITGPVTTGLFNVAALGNMTTGAITSQGDIQSNIGGTIIAGALTSGQRIRGTSSAASTYGALVAGDNIQIQAGGDMTVVSASAGRVNPSTSNQATYEIGIRSATNTTVGDLTAKGNIGLLAQAGNVTAGNATTDQSLVVLSGNKINLGSVATTTTGGTGAGVYLANASMYPLVANNLVPATLFAATAAPVGGSITIGGAVSTSHFTAAAAGTFTSGAITASDLLNINFISGQGVVHGTGLTTGNLFSGKLALLQSDGNIATGSVTASDTIIISTAGTTTLGNLSSGQINPPAFSGQGYSTQVYAANGSTIGSITAKGEVRLQTLNASVTAGNVTTGRDLVILAKQNVTLGAVTTSLVPTSSGTSQTNQVIVPGGIYIGHSNGTSPTSTVVFQTPPTRIEGAIWFGGAVNTGTFIAASAGAFTAPSINSNDFLSIDAGGATMIGALVSRYDTKITGDGAATIGTMDTGGEGHIEVAGQISVGSATAGRMAFASNGTSNSPGTAPVSGTNNASDDGPSVVLIGGAGVSLGTASAAGDIGLVSNNNVVVTGALTSDASVGALVGGNLTLVSVTTGGGANGVYIGSNSLYPSVQNSDGNAADILFATTPPPPIGGSILISGPVSAGRFEAAATGNFTAAAISAMNEIQTVAGGVATFNGAVTAPTIAITSSDLAIGSAGSLGGASTTSLQLTSTSAQTSVGSTTTGASTGQSGLATNYALDNVEFSRLRAQQIKLTAAGNVALGNLSISGSASSTGNLVGSAAGFQVQTPGSIRISGSVNLTNAANTDTLGFVAGTRFEIATDTGQLQLLGTDGKIGGIAAITAANIAVGPSSILTQLAADPKFAGRDVLLASGPLTGSKLDGYLQARQMSFTVGNTLLIQNSGSGSTLAGFTVGAGGIQIKNSSTNPIDVVIYGRAFDSTGTEVPTASIGSVVKATQTNATANVDGCAFATGVCTPVNAGASTQMVAQTQLASISSSVKSAIVGNVGAGAKPVIDNGTSTVGSSVGGGGGGGGSGGAGGGKSDDGEEEPAAKGGGGGGAAAAAKPNVLIDTKSIAASAPPQIDTPVTSSGNTSLWIGEDGLTGNIGTGNGQ